LLVFRRNETQNQKSFFQPFISLLFPIIFFSSVPKITSVWLPHHHVTLTLNPLGQKRRGIKGAAEMGCYHRLLGICLSYFAERDSSKRKVAARTMMTFKETAL